MKRKQKIFMYSTLFIILLVLLGLILYLEIPRIKYTYDKKKDAYIVSEVYGDLKSYTILDEYKGKKVYKIGRKAFQNKANLEGLEFTGNNIEYIDQLAFYNCDSLKEVSLPASIKKIGNNAFLGCDGLEKVSFAENSQLEVLEGSVFYDCLNLKRVSLPQSLLEIGSNCFLNTKIEKLEMYSTTLLLVDALKGVNMANVVILDN